MTTGYACWGPFACLRIDWVSGMRRTSLTRGTRRGTSTPTATFVHLRWKRVARMPAFADEAEAEAEATLSQLAVCPRLGGVRGMLLRS